MGWRTLYFMKSKPVCVGTGLVTLDVIYNDNNSKPNFLAGGSCGNVLTILSYFGWKSFPIARLGNDSEGKRIIEDMKKWGVKTKFIEQESEIHTPRIIERVFAGKKPKHRFYIKCDHRNWLPRRRSYLLKVLEQIQDKLPKSNVFYFDRASPSALQLAKTLKEKNTIIFFEPPKFLDDHIFRECLRIADVFKHCYNQSIETENSGIKIPLEIRTKGKEGLEYKAQFLKQKTWQHMDAFPVTNIVDAAGSGDWLTAGIIHFIGQSTSKTLSQKKLETALRFGQALASLNCNFIGARGIMYYLTKSRVLSLVDKTMTTNESQRINITSKPRVQLTSSLSSKCKVCLCSN